MYGEVHRALFAGSRPGGRGTFLLRGKKVPKEARPAAPACGFPRYGLSVRPASKLAFGSDSKPFFIHFLQRINGVATVELHAELQLSL